MTATATFQDLYFGATQMQVVPFKTSKGGAKVVRFRWMPVAAEGCITTGYGPHGFATVDAAVASASHNARFSNVA